MARTYHITHEFEDGDDSGEVEITFSHIPGCPPCWSSFDGGDPGWPAEVEFITARRLDNRQMTDAFARTVREWLATSEGYSEALHAVAEQDGYAADERADEQREERALEQDR